MFILRATRRKRRVEKCTTKACFSTRGPAAASQTSTALPRPILGQKSLNSINSTAVSSFITHSFLPYLTGKVLPMYLIFYR